MKFGRYLEDNLTPEWKRAYLDYRACKKSIKIIANRLAAGNPDTAREIKEEIDKSSDDDVGPSAIPKKSPVVSMSSKGGSGRSPLSPGRAGGGGGGSSNLNPVSSGNSRRAGVSPGYGSMSTSPRPIGNKASNVPPLDLGESSFEDRPKVAVPIAKDNEGDVATKRNSQQSSEESRGAQSDDNGQGGSESGQHLTATKPSIVKESPNVGKSPRFLNSPRAAGTPKDASNAATPRRGLRSMTMPSPRPSSRPSKIVVTYSDLYDSLESDERAFFDLLQAELDKVESFYKARVADAQRRAHDLRDQLRELAEHRRIFHELYPNGLPEWEAKVGRLLPVPGTGSGFTDMARTLRKRLPFGEDTGNDDVQPSRLNGAANGSASDTAGLSDQQKSQKLREEMGRDAEHHTYNPERYSKYKRDLKHASLEYYRQLELIKNYRIMNLTGFRKALKKFEKTTKIHCLELYTDEKISKETFAKGRVIDDLIKQMEELFTEHFEHGDTKKARDKLRRQQREKTHYFSVFRSGICLGLGLPPAVLALVKACERETQDLIPGWDGMLQIYGGFYLAVIFALLFQLNLDAYVRARINYEFVMELSKPTLDHRSYAEIPAFLFLTLSYCFFFSYYRVSPHNVAPTTWPLAWLVFVCVFFLNPLNILRRRSRYWFLRVLFRVCTPGYSKVEFIAFFLADELNSLTYTVQNIYFIGCTYSHHWPRNVYDVCPSGTSWPYALLLSLPALARLIQCIKRWYDSRLTIHLINAGKYVSSIAQFCLFVTWKSKGRHLHDASFIVWVMIATASSIYTSAWDLIVDWSLLRPKSGWLRPDRGYTSKYVYYFAMFTNVVIRFVWIWYIPMPKHHSNSRSFYFALAEMLRRWQWNFFRVETEHLGNADAYRVTREIPLPYRRIEHDSDEDDKAPQRVKSRQNPITVQLDRLRRELVGGDDNGRGPDEPNVGPRGHARQREYEARRPGDEDVTVVGAV